MHDPQMHIALAGLVTFHQDDAWFSKMTSRLEGDVVCVLCALARKNLSFQLVTSDSSSRLQWVPVT
jgi:hypothetical protein